MYDARIIHEFQRKYKWEGREVHYYRIVFIYSKYEDRAIHVEGIAICEPTDKYNEEFGEKLAKVKAYEKYYHKVKKLMIAETHRPEWRKKQKVELRKSGNDLGDFKYYILNELDRVAERKNYDNLKITIEEI
jgi:hypothetical protein